jgi:hypothetical protein
MRVMDEPEPNCHVSTIRFDGRERDTVRHSMPPKVMFPVPSYC